MSEAEKKNTTAGQDTAVNHPADPEKKEPIDKTEVEGEDVSTKPLDKDVAKSRENKFRGARKSKLDPMIMIQAQHRENKLRIVRIFVMLFIAVIFFVTIWSLVSYLQKRAEIKAKIAETRSQLKTLEESFSEKNDALYDSAINAVKAIRVAEDCGTFASKNCSTSEAEEIQNEMQEKIKKYQEVVLRSNCTGKQNFVSGTAMLDMVYIPNGKFLMGTPDNMPMASTDEYPQSLITIEKPFWIARTEVTFWQFRKLLPTFHVKDWGEYKLDDPDYPAVRMTWDQAMAFCQELTARERRLGRVPKGYEYRLPTEAEWEYACRGRKDVGPEQTQFYWGNEFGEAGSKYANSLDQAAAKRLDRDISEEWGVAADDKFIVVSPVKSFAPNGFGLYDMSGNVAEWCIDYYDPKFYVKRDTLGRQTKDSKIFISPYNLTPVSVAYEDLRNADTTQFTSDTACRVIRGGNWGNVPERLRSARRDYMPQQYGDNGVGFRPVLAPIIQTKQKSEWTR